MRVRVVSKPTKLTVGRAVDWGFAATVGSKLARPAPPATDYTRSQVIEELAGVRAAAEPPVREVTGLQRRAECPTPASSTGPSGSGRRRSRCG